jgi:hypothetical protein
MCFNDICMNFDGIYIFQGISLHSNEIFIYFNVTLMCLEVLQYVLRYIKVSKYISTIFAGISRYFQCIPMAMQ